MKFFGSELVQEVRLVAWQERLTARMGEGSSSYTCHRDFGAVVGAQDGGESLLSTETCSGGGELVFCDVLDDSFSP